MLSIRICAVLIDVELGHLKRIIFTVARKFTEVLSQFIALGITVQLHMILALANVIETNPN